MRRFPAPWTVEAIHSLAGTFFHIDCDSPVSIIVCGEPKRGDFMSNIDYGKLLGFQTVSDHLTGTIDFKDETLGTKLGAKVGGPEPGVPSKPIDHSKLLGFNT